MAAMLGRAASTCGHFQPLDISNLMWSLVTLIQPEAEFVSWGLGQMSARKTGCPESSRPRGSVAKSMSIVPAIA